MSDSDLRLLDRNHVCTMESISKGSARTILYVASRRVNRKNTDQRYSSSPSRRRYGRGDHEPHDTIIEKGWEVESISNADVQTIKFNGGEVKITYARKRVQTPRYSCKGCFLFDFFWYCTGNVTEEDVESIQIDAPLYKIIKIVPDNMERDITAAELSDALLRIKEQEDRDLSTPFRDDDAVSVDTFYDLGSECDDRASSEHRDVLVLSAWAENRSISFHQRTGLIELI